MSTSPLPPPSPSSARTLIVGGGIVGASVAYHLAQLGQTDIVLLEQNALAGGTTWHAAGLIGRLRTTSSMTQINKYSAELYARLESETGHPVGWKQTGSLIVARSQDRMTQLRRTAAMSEWFGVEVQLISPKQALEKWPLLRIDDLLGAAWLPHDGKLIPKELTLALAKGASSRGVRILEHQHVTGLIVRQNHIAGIRTPQGNILADRVVLCGGMWTRQLALTAGVSIPLWPVEHHYAVTEPLPGAFDELPVGRDPDLCIYFRGEGNAVVLGAFQAHSKPWNVPRVPDDFSFQLLNDDWEKFAEPLANGKHRIPALQTCKFDRFVNGPESFTPDNNFLLGETPEIKNLFVAAGFNSVGIASAGGAGRYLAEWIVEGQPTLDLWSVDIRRFSKLANNRRFLQTRVAEILGLHYQMAWPNREFETARNLRLSPLHAALAQAGACFGSRNGWERPNWFARNGGTPTAHYSFDRQNWFAEHALEHRAARQAVALFDQSSFSKYLVQGPGALSLLQRLCGNNVDVPTGRIVYTGLFNRRGGFESDLTLLRLGPDQFYLVGGTTQTVRDLHWIRSNIQPSEQVAVTDITDSWAVIGVMGPNARTLLSRLTDQSLANPDFPFGTAQDLQLAQATARALRITYVGELGWELHVPTSQAAPLLAQLLDAGQDLGVTLAGHYAINSLRLEKAYRAWGAELSPIDTPLEAGLAFAIDWSKPFLGKEALLRQKETGSTRQLATFVLNDPAPVLWGSEPILRNGQPVGYTSSGSHGHTLGAAIAMGYVNAPEPITREFLLEGRYEINVSGSRIPATLHLRPPYDPDRSRILG